jgi:hypothetical protein
MQAIKIHHNCKIDTERFEEGKRSSRRRDHDRVAVQQTLLMADDLAIELIVTGAARTLEICRPT